MALGISGVDHSGRLDDTWDKYTCTLSEDRSGGNAGISRKCKAKNLRIVLEETT
jgi:hypothetical protein